MIKYYYSINNRARIQNNLKIVIIVVIFGALIIGLMIKAISFIDGTSLIKREPIILSNPKQLSKMYNTYRSECSDPNSCESVKSYLNDNPELKARIKETINSNQDQSP